MDAGTRQRPRACGAWPLLPSGRSPLVGSRHLSPTAVAVVVIVMPLSEY